LQNLYDLFKSEASNKIKIKSTRIEGFICDIVQLDSVSYNTKSKKIIVKSLLIKKEFSLDLSKSTLHICKIYNL
jgi:hypothetical protein